LRLTFLIVRMHSKASRHRTRMVEIATNPQGYRVHASAAFNAYATDKNQPTLARYHISGHNFNLNISHSYGPVIGTAADIAYRLLRANQYCSMIAS
jgi:hypothetical protein